MSGKEYTNSGVEVRYPIDAIATNQARDIMDRIIPEWAEEFLRKNRKYKEVTNDLGARGVFPDVNRKVGILKSRLWNGDEVVGEPTREVIMDLVGHLMLMVHMLDEESREDYVRQSGWTVGPITVSDVQATSQTILDEIATRPRFAPDLATGQVFALDRAAGRITASALQKRFDEEERLENGSKKRNHQYDELLNCIVCGHAHVGPASSMYRTACPGPRSKVSRSEMTVSERLELDGGRH